MASSFPGVSVEQMRRRIRANLEIGGLPPFWEDHLFSRQSDTTVSFRVGNVCFVGVQACQRCVVTPCDSDSGQADSNFQKIFITQRQATLADWVALSRFNHFYKLSINTRLSISSVESMLQISNEIAVIA